LHVHFVAIGGTGMGSLAGLLKRRGLEVTGSDGVLYPPMSDALRAWGIPVFEGFHPDHVLGRRPDLVVIGNAVRPDNPEARAAIDAGLPHRSFPDALYELAIEGRHSVVVAGTHGKTTTTSLLATLLERTGRDPSLLVGGIAANFDGSFREGKGPHFVVEGDEYDTAFFDKTPKFLHYHPRTLILTSIEFDHADIYRDLEHVKQAFAKLVASLPRDGTIVAAEDDPNVREVVARAPCRVVGYAVEGVPGIEWQTRFVTPDSRGTRFEVMRGGARVASAQLPMHGRHNVANALAALAACEVLGVPVVEAAAALPAFRGVKRRQELRGEAAGVTVVDDFAHHPTAVAGTIDAVRARFPDRRVVAVFEPRSNTSRRALFQREYARALARADRTVILRVPDAPLYSAFGEVKDRLSADALVADLEERGRQAVALDDVDAIVEDLYQGRRRGDVVLVMSNGSFGNVWEKLLGRLRG
jgi:UDP-N-acetylmuramate: L-alanyl-gamma-D-glutamyl-meso-diaminopimelate ligase